MVLKREFLLYTLICRAADSDNTLATMAKIIGVIGRNDSQTANVAVNDLITMSRRLSESLPIILKEIEGK